jgi:diphosphomevalonate decarboxylase
MKTARAIAHSNIALVKYWGKRPDVDPELNLPAVGSLSMTLEALWTQTRIEPSSRDRFELDGDDLTEAAAGVKARRHLDRLWRLARHTGSRPPCNVVSTNHLPTAAGLASSASGFAALTLAGAAALELEADPSQLSAWARMGSGSAARSIWGGFVRLDRGRAADGSDCVARPLLGAEAWPLRLVVVQTTRGPKPVGSTAGMQRCRETSPYYRPWVETSEADLDAAQAALERRDLEALGPIVEHSAMKMHACMMATQPPIVYWKPATLAVLAAVQAAREDGLPAYATMDAGPHVKVLCPVEHAEALVDRMTTLAGVEEVTVSGVGPDAHVEVEA